MDNKYAFGAGVAITLGGLYYLKQKYPTNSILQKLGDERRINSLQSTGTPCQSLWQSAAQICGNPCPVCDCPQNPEQGFGFYGQGAMAPAPVQYRLAPTFTTPPTPTPTAFRRVPPHAAPVRY